MPLSNARELKEDVLFRASEPLTGSGWNGKAMDYLNRVYRTLCTGASEFLPEYVDDWWWMRASDTLILEPSYNTGTIALTNGAALVSFSVPPAISMAGRRLRIKDYHDIFVVEAHIAGQANATLDDIYTGPTNTAALFECMKVEYTLAANVQVLMGPLISYKGTERVYGLSPERMDELWPLARLKPGAPEAFCLNSEKAIRISHGGRNDGVSMRIEYRYRPIVTDLTDSVSSIPLVPAQWMHVLADMALVYVLLDKNDDRSNAAALGARTGLSAMLKENRRRGNKVDQHAGHLFPRPGNRWLKHETGE